MAKTKTVKKSKKASRKMVNTAEPDSIYFLKLVLYLILGSQWLRLTGGSFHIPLPIGLGIGLLFARTERFSIDRKIEYAILLIAAFVGFWLPLGFEIVL